MRIPAGEPIDRLEAGAAAVTDTRPIIPAFDYVKETSFVDNNVSLSWLTSGCSFRDDVDPLLAGLWFYLALRQDMKWWERVSSAFNVADRPNWGLAPECPCG